MASERRDLADQDGGAVVHEQPRRGDRRLLGLPLVVVGLELDELPLHAALRVGLLDGELQPLVRRVAEGGLVPGERADVAEDDHVSDDRGGAGRRGGRLGGGLLLAGDGGEGGGEERERADGAHRGLLWRRVEPPSYHTDAPARWHNAAR